jgi:hypothetical protein
LKEILYQSAYDLDEYNPRYAGQLGHGCVDAAAALEIDVSNLHHFIFHNQAHVSCRKLQQDRWSIYRYFPRYRQMV